MISVDMDKARDIWRDKLRKERMSELQKLDVAYMKALEMNDATAIAQIVERKQVLRDAPSHPDIETAQTPEELKQVWPIGGND